MTGPVVEASDLSYAYQGTDGPVPVLRGTDLTVRGGEFVAIVGPSGCGKSTLLTLLGGLEQPQAGTIRVADRDLRTLGAKELESFRQHVVAFVFQFFNLLPTLTAWENVLLGLEAMVPMPRDARQRADQWLERVGLAAKRDRFPGQLSGGEQQRVAIARALAKETPLVLADEPTGNLDEETAAAVLELFVAAQRMSGSAVVLITHDAKIAARADRVVELTRGRLHEAPWVARYGVDWPAGSPPAQAGRGPA
ncbi:ABC transporter ATP-binding protein [Frankia sp. Cpl3]|uniref:ABC transporter ATP-binding protein n=1 Tax=Parafrankia colletiae TaxID=573497 RepID=UPI000A054358|nr:ABC transporter ATP-binding protein [Parafrankia colletiae]MCK9903796.1 ABC transporter ATP-binding protein [Frankia sp. Cpl3]